MKISQLFHQYTKNFRKRFLDPFDWPEEWKTVYYKTYPRLPVINLSTNTINDGIGLFKTIEKRVSRREFKGGSISLSQLSSLLKYSCGLVDRKTETGRRSYPSAGARFPIEAYCLVLNPGEGLRHGLFHYNIKDHSLEILLEEKITREELEKIASYEFIANSSLIIFLTAVFWRTQNKYGERGYRFVLIETGHIGQNVYLVSEALGLKCCAVGGFRVSDRQIEEYLDIDGNNESIVYTFAIGA